MQTECTILFMRGKNFLCYNPAMPRYSCNQCGKSYMGPAVRGMMCNCSPPRPMAISPLSTELQEHLRIQEATQRRSELCRAWGIDNLSHGSHGSNFSGTQSLVQLINDIVNPLVGANRARVRLLVIAQYQYDIDTRQMD